MRWVPPPAPPSRHDVSFGRFKGDAQLAAWRQRRGFSEALHDDPSTLGMTQGHLAYLLLEVERRRLSARYRAADSRDRADVRIDFASLGDHLFEAMCAITPRLSAPELDPNDKVGTLAHVFAQPEVQDFLLSWQSPRRLTSTGPRPFDDGAKALLCLMGMTKHNHATAAYQDLYEMPRMRQMFADALQMAARRHDLPDPEPFTLALYEGTTGRIKPLAQPATFRPLVLQAKARMFKALRDLYPDARFGERLLIDGHLMPAWCPQRGRGATAAQEQERRATTPHAGARLVEYTRSGKRSLAATDRVAGRALMGHTAFARGYYYVCIIDQASGWPLVSMLQDASYDEAEALIPLLSDLYKYYDFIEPKYIAGDGAWDETWAHRACELFYGLSPVFRHTDRASVAWTDLNVRSVRGYTHEGRTRCRDHNRLLPFHSFERPSRNGLRPGQGAPGHPDSDGYKRELLSREGQFRVRYADTHDPLHSARPSLRADIDWRRLCAVPRYPEGRPDLYALRRALMVRLRNQMEGHFSRTLTAVGLGTDDADRVRLQDMDSLSVLFQLAELRFSALSLAAERAHLGQAPPPLPGTAPVAPLPVKRRGGGNAARQAARAARVAGTPTTSRQPETPETRSSVRAREPVEITPGGVPIRRRRPHRRKPEHRHEIPSALTVDETNPAALSIASEMSPEEAFAPSDDPPQARPVGRSALAHVRPAEAGSVTTFAFRARPLHPVGEIGPSSSSGSSPLAEIIRVDFGARRRIPRVTRAGAP
ncbi:MAG: hypothetical protein WBD40_19030 [Tepidisphaeraceae bacterium]